MNQTSVRNIFVLDIFLNIGAVLGPIIGIYAYKIIPNGAFFLTSIVYLLLFITTIIYLKTRAFKAESELNSFNFLSTIVVLKDFKLLCWVISGALVLMAYGSYEAFMPIIVQQSHGTRPSFGVLLSLNAITVIVFQIIHLKFLKWLSFSQNLMFGVALIVLGFLMFTFKVYSFEMTVIAVIIFSIGESLLFPCFEVLMGKIAPTKNKALYFSVGEVKQIGFFLGPVAGSWIYESGGYLIPRIPVG